MENRIMYDSINSRNLPNISTKFRQKSPQSPVYISLILTGSVVDPFQGVPDDGALHPVLLRLLHPHSVAVPTQNLLAKLCEERLENFLAVNIQILIAI